MGCSAGRRSILSFLGGVYLQEFWNSELWFAKVCRNFWGKFGHLHAHWRPFGDTCLGNLSFCLRKSVGFFFWKVWALACSLETFWCACLRLFDIRSRERGRRLLAQIQQSLLD